MLERPLRTSGLSHLRSGKTCGLQDVTLTPGWFGATLACMQTLGLSGESRRSDGWLKSIFWPTVENAWDVDYLGHQGFWICVIVAAVQLILGVLSGNPLFFAIFVAMSLVYFLGAMGVRQASWPAAALLFSLSFIGLLHSMVLGQFPSILAIGIAAVLLSNTQRPFSLRNGGLPAKTKTSRRGLARPFEISLSISGPRKHGRSCRFRSSHWRQSCFS